MREPHLAPPDVGVIHVRDLEFTSANQPLLNLMSIISVCSEEIFLNTGNDESVLFKEDPRFHVSGTGHIQGASSVSRICRYIWTQIRISYLAIQRIPNVDKWIFFDGNGVHLPLLTTKVFHKHTALLLADTSNGITQDPLSLFKSAFSTDLCSCLITSFSVPLDSSPNGISKKIATRSSSFKGTSSISTPSPSHFPP